MTEPRRLVAQRVTPESFAPFGRILGQDDDPPERQVVARFTGGQEPMPSIIDEVNPDGVPVCTWLARHHHQSQALTPIDGPILLVLAPAGVDPRSEAGRAATTAFVADVAEGVLLDIGVWHWGASVRRGRVRVSNLQGHRWPEDNDVRSLEDGGLAWAPRHEWLDRAWAADLLHLGTERLAALTGTTLDAAAGADGAPSAVRLDEGRWRVSDAAGTVELDEATVEQAVRAAGPA